MGRIISNKVRSMNWMAKISLVLVFTVFLSILGLYIPKTAQAAPVTYHVRGLTSVSVGADGATNIISEAAASYSPTLAGTNQFRAITNTTAPTGTSRNRLRLSATGTGNDIEFFRAYTPVYASGVNIAANATTHITGQLATLGGGGSVYAVMYEYNDTTGVVGAAKGTTPTQAFALNTTGQQFDLTFPNSAFAVAPGNRIVVYYYWNSLALARPVYLYGATWNAVTPAGSTYFTVDETTGDTTTPIVGTVNVTPKSTTFTTGSPTITASISDIESPVTACQYTTNGGTWAAGVLTGSSSPWTCTANPTGLTGALSINMRGQSSAPGYGTGTAVPLTVDVTAPTTTDNLITEIWTNVEQPVILTPDDAGGSGVTAATGIYGCFGTGCTPVLLGGNTMTSNCGTVAECQYDVRYYSKDNLNWTEATKTSTYQVWIDRAAPAGLAANTPADEAIDLPTSTAVTSTTATDTGSGFVDYYFEVDSDVAFTAPQFSDWQATTSFEPSLAAGVTYFWRVKAKDTLGNETPWTVPRSFSTLAACVRNDPTLTLETDTAAIQGFITVNGGTKDYIFKIINNDYGGCPNTTFDISISDTDSGNNFEAPILASPSVTLAPGAQTTVGVTVTATANKYSGQSLTRVTSASDVNHALVNSNNVTTFINVVDCTANAPYLIIGPNSNNVAIGGTIEYTVTVQNLDTGSGCSPVTFDINIDSETNAPSAHFNASTLSLPSKTLSPGQKGSVTLTVSTLPGAIKDQINVTTLSVTEAGHASPPVATATTTVGNRILHNSINTDSTKWQSSGGWGVPGGRYGEFDCMTCHTSSDATNIKKVRSSIVTPNPASGTLPGDSQPIVFTQVSSSTGAVGVYGDDSDATRASSNRICEVCHKYDATGVNGVRVHAYDQVTYVSDTITNNHQNANASDCILCHKHKVGFMPPDCGSCHGNPPGAGSPVGPLASSPFTTGSVTVGAHNTHFTTLGYGCNTCHTGSQMPHESAVLPGQGDINISFNAFGDTSGTYSGQTGVSYNDVEGTGGLNCSAVYCHGSTLDGTSTTAQWDGTVACGNCHRATAGNPPTIGSHTRHAGNGSGELSLSCSDCHGTNGAGGTGHVGGTVQWGLNTSNARFGTNAKYNSAASGTISSLAPSSSYQTCTTVYCHSNVQGASGVGAPSSSGSPVWGGSTLGCAGCHVDMSGASGLGSHIKHANVYGMTCANCHTGYTPTTTNGTLHADNTIDVALASGTYSGGTVPGDNAPGGGYGSCSTNTCHSDGQAAPSTYTNPSWGGTAACGTCHGILDSTPPASTSHTKHVGADNYKYACYKCHTNVTVTADSTSPAALNGTYTTTHSNGTRNVDFDASTVSGSWSGTQCSNTYCHSQGTTFTVASATHTAISWSGSKTCADCHDGTAAGPGYTNNSPKANTHAQHVTTSGYVCADCHSSTVNGSNSIIDTSKHLNRAYDVSGASITSYTYVSDGGTCATNCHGPNSVKWGTQTGDATCVKCHGVAGTDPATYAANPANAAPGFNNTGRDFNGDSAATDSQVGAHNAHLNATDNYSSKIACSECHVVPATSDAAGHLGSALPAELTFGSLATTNVGSTTAPNYASPSCTNTYCHYGKSLSGYSPATANAAVAWTNTAYLSGTPSLAGDCNMCHLSPPVTTGSHSTGMTISQCAGCHTHLNADGTFNDVSKHVNGSIDAAGGGCGGCHDFDVNGANYAGGVWTNGTWGKAPHRDDPVNEGWGAHAVHINHIKTKLAITTVLSSTGQTFGVGVPANVCGTCHTNTESGNHSVGGSMVRTINFGDGTYKYGGASGFSFVLSGTNPTYNGVTGTSSAADPKTCSSVSCHFSTTPVWSAY